MNEQRRPAAEGSVFRAFIRALREHWKSVLPSVRPVGVSYPSVGPKASTFYAGTIPASGQHVFLNFQHSSKACQVGQFTINVTLSKQLPPPRAIPFPPEHWKTLEDGYYRIGILRPPRNGRRKDKWWHLRQDKPSVATEAWYTSDYSDKSTVIREAVADVTHDVRSLLERLGAEYSEASNGGPSAVNA